MIIDVFPKEHINKDQIIQFLWQLLDDIDTASDWAKSNDIAYRRAVEKIQKRRWETGITCDGYSITLPAGESDE